MRIKEIQYEAGITIEVKGAYFKESIREVVEVDENDDPDEVRNDLVDRLHNFVDKQISEIKVANK